MDSLKSAPKVQAEAPTKVEAVPETEDIPEIQMAHHGDFNIPEVDNNIGNDLNEIEDMDVDQQQEINDENDL